jgi:hypothetical protein
MNSNRPARSLWRRVLRLVLWAFAALVALVLARCLYAFRDRNPGYTLAVAIDSVKARTEPRPLRVGFARMKINPDLSDPKRPVWLAGFDQHRAATRVHDDLWAIACVIEDGYTRLGIVALDAIGLFHDDVIRVRRRLAPDWKLDYTIVCTTHNHSTPDLLGLWGPDFFHTGVERSYREQVVSAAAKALGDAVAALQPAHVTFHEIPTPTAGLVADTRRPEVFDPDIRLMHFINPTNRATLGTVVGWADHPETVWSKNTEITSDFCGYLRQALELGVIQDDKLLAPGVGGIHVYINGAIGGLISTTPSVTVRDPYLGQDFKTPTHEKARAVGRQLAWRILPRLADTNAPAISHAPISIQARTIEVPLDNAGFLIAPVIGLLDRGHVRWKTFRTEVALVTVGHASIACIPGEIYPEIVNGGIENVPGGDFALEPVEVPPIRELMPGKIKFVFGLANDEIGYIIPKSEWDRKPPFLYGATRGVYGEINSVGPDAAGKIHEAMRELCRASANTLEQGR